MVEEAVEEEFLVGGAAMEEEFLLSMGALHQHVVEETLEEEFLVIEEAMEEEFLVGKEVGMGTLHQHVVKEAMDEEFPREAVYGDHTMIREIKDNQATIWDLLYRNGCSNPRRSRTIPSHNRLQRKPV